MSRGSISISENIRPILGAIRTVPIPPKTDEKPPPPVLPFVTISREPGAGAWALARQLVESLNISDPGPHPWTCWDRELMEKVAADYHLSKELIESLEEAHHSWMMDFLGALSLSDSTAYADEAKVYGRVAATIRALARTGRVVIVGGGGVFVTKHMPGGIHVRLVAPLDYRIAFIAREHNVTPKEAAAYIKDREHNRQVFFKRYWRDETLEPHSFTVTINSAAVEMPAMVEAIKALTRFPVPVRR